MTLIESASNPSLSFMLFNSQMILRNVLARVFSYGVGNTAQSNVDNAFLLLAIAKSRNALSTFNWAVFPTPYEKMRANTFLRIIWGIEKHVKLTMADITVLVYERDQASWIMETTYCVICLVQVHLRSEVLCICAVIYLYRVQINLLSSD